KRNRLGQTIFWLGTFLVFIYLSMGPYLRVDTSGNNLVPGIYLLYMHLPVFNIIREPGRFDMVATLALAVLAGFGSKELLNNARFERYVRSGFKKYLVAILIVLILVEYTGVPIVPSYANALFATNNIPNVYGQIGRMPGNFSVLILPTTFSYAAQAMYYQTVFQRPIIDGYISRITVTEFDVANKIPLVAAANNLQNGNGFVYTSTASGGYENVTMFWLSKYNVRLVSIIAGAYTVSELATLEGNCTALFGAPIYQDNTTILFNVG
ncbi:MAG: hypothetical protein ACREAN_08995, partial [Nitrosopumilaceae archaeon]